MNGDRILITKGDTNATLAVRTSGRRLATSAILAAVGLLSLSVHASAAVYTWNGPSGNGNWSAAANWIGGAPVSAIDTALVFGDGNAGGIAYNARDNISNANFILNAITLSGTTGANTVASNPVTNGLQLDGTNPGIWQSGAANFVVSNNFTFAANITLAGTGAGTVTLSGVLKDNGANFGITKSDSSAFVLSGVNAFGGSVLVTGGTLIAANSSALGTGAVNVSAGTLGLRGTTALNNALTLGSATSSAALVNLANVNTLAGPVTLGGDATLASSAGTLSLTSTIDTAGHVLTLSGAGALTVGATGAINGNGSVVIENNSAAAWVFLSANNYTGGTTINAGSVTVSLSGALGSGTVTVSDGAVNFRNISTLPNVIVLNNATLNSISQSNTVSGLVSVSTSSRFAAAAGTPNIGSAAPGTTVLQVASGTTLAFTNAGNIAVNGDITAPGAFNIVKDGAGVLTLLGNGNQTGGTVEVLAGTLNLRTNTGLGVNTSAGAGAVSVATGATLALQGSVVGSNTDAGVRPLSLAGTLQALANTTNAWRGNITLSGDAAIQVNNNVGTRVLTIGSASSTLDLSGHVLTLGGTSSSSGVVTAQITGAGSLLVQTASTAGVYGAWSITDAANNFTGTTTIASGVLNVTGGGVLPSSQVAVSIDGTLNVTNATTNALSASAVSLSNDGTVTFAGSQTLATLTGSTGVVNAAGTLTVLGGNYGGAIAGTGALRVDGEVTLAGSNSTYTGGTTVVGGTLKAGASHALPTATSLTVNGGAAFNLGGFDQQVATLASTSSISTVLNSEATASTLTVSPTSATVTTYAGHISGNVSLAFGGAAGSTEILTGTSDYQGTTTINSGALLVNGSIDGAGGAVTVNSGGTLGGDGVIARDLNIAAGGTISPGGGSDSAGRLTLGGNTSFSGTYVWNLTALGAPSSSPQSRAGMAYDQLQFAGGTITVNSGAAIELALAPSTTPNEVDLFWQQHETWAVFSGVGGLSFNAPLSLVAPGFAFGGFSLDQSLAGDELLLNWNPTAVPEPGTLLLVSVAALGFGIYKRRRRRIE
jgi:autotransporter-associated beta strand protein